MKTKIASIGELDVILPFKAIGADIYPVSTAEQAREVLQELLKQEIGLILVPDDLVPDIRDLMIQVRGEALPCILPIPGSKGSSGAKTKEIRELIRRAVGIDIMKNG
jgi:V/A-type H+-transporting ATPase subunit F